MQVHFMGAGPGATDLITLRALHLLSSSPICLYAGATINPDLLKYCPKEARLINSAPLSLVEIESIFLQAQKDNQDIARLHSGDLSIYSALAEQIQLLKRLHIAYSITPGVPAFAAAAAAIESELTVPHVAQTVVLTRINGRASPMPSSESLEVYASTRATLAIHLAIHRLSEIIQRLIPFYGKDCPVAIVFHASWPDQKFWKTRLDEIENLLQSEEKTLSSALILIGRALDAENFLPSALYEKNYARQFRTFSAN